MEVDPDRPVLVDKYLDRADELDVDALCDKDGNVVICGIMQHIEQAGVHSGAQHAAVMCCFKDPAASTASVSVCSQNGRELKTSKTYKYLQVQFHSSAC